MNTNKIGALFLSLAIVFSNLEAQVDVEKPPLPDGPLIRKIADYAVWQVDYRYSQDNPAGENPEASETALIEDVTVKPKKAIFTCTKPFWSVKLTGEKAGLTLTEWSDGNHRYTESRDSKTADFSTMGDQPGVDIRSAAVLILAFANSEFPEMGWVSPKTFTGIQKIGERSCMTFQQDEMRVWIDVGTRYPVAWQKGQESRIFQQLSPPNQKLSLPAAITGLAAGMKRDHDAISRKRARE